ncbi:MAG: Crp/Fnr family transcriptional regulator [Bacteroidota bacterium]
MDFIHYLESVIKVSGILKEELHKLTKERIVKKGQLIIRNGDRCADLFFVEQGLLRGYYYNDDKEITNWFAQEGEFATCFYSFISKAASYENIEALDDSRLLQLPYCSLQDVYIRYPETERIGRVLTESYYIKLEERLLSLRFTTAKERYDNLLVKNPALLQGAQLGHIASYLGITQETLSRIRAKH